MGVGTYSLLDSTAEVLTYLGSVPERDGLWIYCSASGATAATAAVSATALTLIITGGESAGTNTLTFADANKDTLAELVTAINALTGWKAGLIYNGSAASTDLIVTGTLACNTAANELTLKVKDLYLIERLIDRATDIIERFCQRKFKSRDYSREIYSGTGYTSLWLKQWPVSRVSRVSVGRTSAFSVKNTTATTWATAEVTATGVRLVADGGTATDLLFANYATITLLVAAISAQAGWTASLLASSYGPLKSTECLRRPSMSCKSPDFAYVEIPTEDVSGYYLISPDEERNAGELFHEGIWTSSDQNIFIDYTAGYSTIPDVLQDACVQLVVWKYRMSEGDPTMKSESLGDYSYTRGDLVEGLSAEVREQLSYFRRPVL
jgi:hypothetical protein